MASSVSSLQLSSGKIPLGFGLSGYSSKSSTSNQSQENLNQFNAGIGTMSTSDAVWSGGLVDDRWVIDENLKQVQVQVSCFQSVPLVYEHDGKNSYAEMRDEVGDAPSVVGGGAFTGAVRRKRKWFVWCCN